VGWKLWYTHGERHCTNSEILERQPEAGLIDLSVDPVRVYEGSQALKVHTYCGCHNIRLYQTVPVEVGLNYRASIYMHHWYSDCSSEPHTEPLMRDCKTPFSSAWAELRLGVDPLGLDDPQSESIVWTEPTQQYGFYNTEWRVDAVAESEKLTVVASSWTSYPLMHEDWYVDAAVLVEV
jgi:hypothetical protein